MLDHQLLENDYAIKIYSLKNRAVSITGTFLTGLLCYLFLNEVSHFRKFNYLPFTQIFSSSRHVFSMKLVLIGVGIAFALLLLLVSHFPSVVISQKQIKIGWKWVGKNALSYQHHIPWDRIAQIDSGGSKQIQWSPKTSLIYHTGKIPVGYSTDLAEAVVSTELGYHNYCKILDIVLQKAPKARVDNLTLRLIKNCQKSWR